MMQEGELGLNYGKDQSSVLLIPAQMKKPPNVLSVSFIFSIFFLSLIMPVSAETISYCQSIPVQATDWNSSIILPKFDPEMGNLTDVEIKCALNLSQRILAENFNNNSINYSVIISGQFLADLPGSESISININRSTNGRLNASDNSTDFSGPSGINTSTNIETEPAIARANSLEAFIAKLPEENITIPSSTYITSLVNIPGSASIGVRVNAGADVCISYAYDRRE